MSFNIFPAADLLRQSGAGHREGALFWVDLGLIAVLTAFMFSFFDSRLLMLNTIPTGGDMASWYAQAAHLAYVLLPSGRLTGWDMGHFAGHPSFRFYFVLPFLLAVIPSKLAGIPLAICLKWVMMAGVFLLPLSTWLGLRLMRCRFPIPVAGAAAAVVFVLNESFSIFGGNALSTLAGEFCYMLSFALLPLFIGTFHRWALPERHAALLGALLGIIGLCHMFVLLPALAVVAFGYFTGVRCTYLIKVAASALGLMAFWLLPLMAQRITYSTPMGMVWDPLDSWAALGLAAAIVLAAVTPRAAWQVRGMKHRGPLAEAVLNWTALLGMGLLVATLACAGLVLVLAFLACLPVAATCRRFWPLLCAVAALGPSLAACLGCTVRGRARLTRVLERLSPRRFALWMALAAGSAAAYFWAFFLQVPDIRFLPPLVFALSMAVAAETVGPFLAAGSAAERAMWGLSLCVLALWVATAGAGSAGKWYRYNFLGYESTAGYAEFAALNSYLRDEAGDRWGDPLNAPRVAYEKSDLYTAYGGDRAFEALPLFSGRQTLEGIDYAGALGARCIAFLQSTFSKEVKAPEARVFSRIDPAAAAAYCKLYNISELVIVSREAAQALAQSPWFDLEKRFGLLALFRFTQNCSSYVEVPAIRPVRLKGSDWTGAFYDWFKHPDRLGVLLVPDAFVHDALDREVLKEVAGNPSDLGRFRGDRLPDAEAVVTAKVEQHRITFETNRIGVPHLIKVSYFPDWRVEGANGVYPVSPHFMLVIPRKQKVTLRYERQACEKAGWLITAIWAAAMVACAGPFKLFMAWREGRSAELDRKVSLVERVGAKLRRPAAVAVSAVLLAGAISGAVLRNSPVRIADKGAYFYQQGLALKKQGRRDDAATAFRYAVAVMTPLLEKRLRCDNRAVLGCILETAGALEQVGELQNAKYWYKILLEEYPYSREAYTARARVALLSRRSYPALPAHAYPSSRSLRSVLPCL